MRHGTVLVSLALIAGGSPAASAQATGGTSTALTAATYTAEQAARGDTVYRRACVECHETLEYTGAEFRAKWSGRPAFELFDLLRTTMPEETPGSLSREQYADVLAYMLKLNAAPASTTPLPSSDDELKKLKLDIPTAGRR